MTTFVEKVITFLKGGDEAKIARFHAKLVKNIQKQINIRADQIEQLEEKIADDKEKLEEAKLSVDLDRIKTSEAIEEYSIVFAGNLIDLRRCIKSKEEEVASVKEEIAELLEVQKLLA